MTAPLRFTRADTWRDAFSPSTCRSPHRSQKLSSISDLPADTIKEMVMSETLTRKEARAVRLLADGCAHELAEKPLEVLSSLVAKGIAKRTPYNHRYKGKLWPSFRTELTEYGRTYATPQGER